MHVLILEDEIPAYEKLKAYISECFDDNLDITWLKSVKEGLTYFSKEPRIDLIISDIELLDGTSFSLFEKIDISTPIIFCTAYDQYLLKAFKTKNVKNLS